MSNQTATALSYSDGNGVEDGDDATLASEPQTTVQIPRTKAVGRLEISLQIPPSTAGGAVEGATELLFKVARSVATGSGILELMDVEGLTLNQVNSHLNYCRIKYGALPKSSNRFPPMIALQTPQSSEGATELLSKIARPVKHGKVLVDLFGSLGGLAILHGDKVLKKLDVPFLR